MRVLMSIKPEFVAKIFRGDKKYEFRRVLFKRTDVESIVIYATHPVSKIVGEVTVDSILVDKPSKIWTRTKRESGISKEYFDSYFSGKELANAICIKSTEQYLTPISLSEMNVRRAPQSFCYIN